jgi:hypothetical protein
MVNNAGTPVSPPPRLLTATGTGSRSPTDPPHHHRPAASDHPGHRKELPVTGAPVRIERPVTGRPGRLRSTRPPPADRPLDCVISVLGQAERCSYGLSRHAVTFPGFTLLG